MFRNNGGDTEKAKVVGKLGFSREKETFLSIFHNFLSIYGRIEKIDFL
ncbi:TPA: hypothetical protein ACGO39_002206 [Streptococcus suis]|nr:hypothetical protein [Streptococcus suis]HEM2759127.1 hypothetical protein [Streptococcus suis]HEM2765139.1 hypothetical protein [Streptococcus suis]HEM3590538.1 hypothetical protein [Streptococcus suis]